MSIDAIVTRFQGVMPADRAPRTKRAIDVLLPALHGEPIYGGEFKDAKATLDRSFEEAFEALSSTDYSTYWEPDGKTVSARGQIRNALGFAVGLRSAIALKKKASKIKIDHPQLEKIRDLLDASAAMAELMEKLKTKVIKGRRPPAGGSSKDRRIAARAGGSGTCQICAGNQALVSGKIALHGYQRPGLGFIQGRCRGSGELPFEVSCEVLRGWIAMLRRRLTEAHDSLAKVPVRDSFTITESRGRNRPPMVVVVRRGEPRFGSARDATARALEHEIRSLNREIADQEKRLAAWVPVPLPAG